MRFKNVFLGYNEEEDFRILISAWSKAEAIDLAEGYRKDAGLQGKFDVSEAPECIDNIRFDCDYIVTDCDSALGDEKRECANDGSVGVRGNGGKDGKTY